jgi:type IV secretion system protein TrbJ
MKKKLAMILAFTLVVTPPALAILGLGDIVFDPSNFEEAVQQLLQLEQQYTQLVQTYQMITNEYNEMLWMARPDPVNMALRYRGLATPWTPLSATNTYGTTAAWVAGVNSGLGVAAGYASATEPLQTYGSALGNIPAEQLNRVKTNYATVELTDGANLSAIATLGDLRANAQSMETAIQNLEADSLSSDPAMNTEIAVLNKINAADVIGLRNGQDANKLLAALAEERIIQAKQQRDAEAQAFNIHIGFMSQGQAFMAAQAANASGAMMAWRMP